jgi:hypothetical protein
LPELRKLPFFQKTYADLSDDFILQAWERRGEFISALESLPQTFCHQDAFDGNLIWRHNTAGQDQLVGLDWAYTGNAALGEELAPLAFMYIGQNKKQHYELCLRGYLAGLADAGYVADARQVRFASLAAIFYRYFYGSIFGELWNGLRNEANHPFIASQLGIPTIEILFGFLSADVPFFKYINQEISEMLPQMV